MLRSPRRSSAQREQASAESIDGVAERDLHAERRPPRTSRRRRARAAAPTRRASAPTPAPKRDRERSRARSSSREHRRGAARRRRAGSRARSGGCGAGRPDVAERAECRAETPKVVSRTVPDEITNGHQQVEERRLAGWSPAGTRGGDLDGVGAARAPFWSTSGAVTGSSATTRAPPEARRPRRRRPRRRSPARQRRSAACAARAVESPQLPAAEPSAPTGGGRRRAVRSPPAASRSSSGTSRTGRAGTPITTARGRRRA